MDICDVEPAKKPEHILLKNMRRRIIDCFNDMGVPWEEYRKFLVTGERIPRLRMFTKSHKASSGYPSRPVVSQIDDPTYLLCKELTQILLPIKEKAESFIRNSYHLKEILSKANLQNFRRLIQISFDMSNIYPSIPI